MSLMEIPREPDPVDVGKRIKQARMKAGYSQSQIAEKAGIAVSLYWSYEKGKKKIGIYPLTKIAHILKTNVENLYLGNCVKESIRSSSTHGDAILTAAEYLYCCGILKGKSDGDNQYQLILSGYVTQPIGKYLYELEDSEREDGIPFTSNKSEYLLTFRNRAVKSLNEFPLYERWIYAIREVDY